MRRRGVIEPDPAHADAVDCDEPSVEIKREPVAEFALQGEQLGWPRRLRTGTVPHIKPVDHRNRLPRLLHELQQCRIDLRRERRVPGPKCRSGNSCCKEQVKYCPKSHWRRPRYATRCSGPQSLAREPGAVGEGLQLDPDDARMDF